MGPNHAFPASILLPYNKPTRNNSRFSKTLFNFNLWQLAYAVPSAWNACFPFYLWQNCTQPSGPSSFLLFLKLSCLYHFFLVKVIYSLCILFTPKVISSYNITWLVVCLLRQTLSISGIYCLILCLPSTQHSA